MVCGGLCGASVGDLVGSLVDFQFVGSVGDIFWVTVLTYKTGDEFFFLITSSLIVQMRKTVPRT